MRSAKSPGGVFISTYNSGADAAHDLENLMSSEFGRVAAYTSAAAGYTEAGGIAWKGLWAQALPLIGVRDTGTPCSGNSGVAQSPDGKPMICEGGAWTPHGG
jgi:hypothetical protein